MDRRLKFLICTVAIFVAYFYYGIIQEKITRTAYGNEKFTSFLTLVFVQCVVNYLYAIFISCIVMQQGEDTTKTIYYVGCALTYLIAMLCSTLALKWVNYPTQVIGKSAKPIPVMILSVLLAGKSYAFKKYCFVLLVVVGVASFMYDDKKAGTSNTLFGYGEMMILLSLLMDGLLAAIEERMRSESGTKSGHLMMNTNKWSVVFLGVAVLSTGEYASFFDFTRRHPAILWEVVSFSAASAFGQFFIFLMVSDFGPLPCSIITTTRKFFTILASAVIFSNAMSPRQWLATCLVFVGLFLNSFFGPKPSPPDELPIVGLQRQNTFTKDEPSSIPVRKNSFKNGGAKTTTTTPTAGAGDGSSSPQFKSGIPSRIKEPSPKVGRPPNGASASGHGHHAYADRSPDFAKSRWSVSENNLNSPGVLKAASNCSLNSGSSVNVVVVAPAKLSPSASQSALPVRRDTSARMTSLNAFRK